MSESQPKSRRGFMLGAAAASAATAAVVALPKGAAVETPVSEIEPPKPQKGGGYRVTDHVRQYYKTTLV
jgi:cobalamin biosynthesis protein CbiD